MDAHAVLHLVLTQLKSGGTLGGDGAGGKRKADALHAGGGFLGNLLDLSQGLARLGGGSGNLVDKDRTGHATAAYGVQAVLDGDVVVDLDIIYVDAVLLGQERGVAEIHDIAAVVLDNQQSARVAGGLLDGLIDLNLGGRGEHVAAHRRVQHTLAHKTGVGGLVAAAAAADEGHFALVQLFFVDDLIFYIHFQLRVGQHDTGAHLPNDSCGVID